MCWTLTEQAGDATPYGLQHLLSRARWDAYAVRDDIRGFVVERLRHEDGRTHTFAFGRQLDVRTIRSADFEGGQELTERAVAAYIAKYATKGAETATGTLDRPIKFLAELAGARITDHARRMIRTAWDLGARPELADLRLRAWAHMLGFRGHFSTKSRRYSTTLGALRDAPAPTGAAPKSPRPSRRTTKPRSSSPTGSSPELVSAVVSSGWPHPSNPPPERKESRRRAPMGCSSSVRRVLPSGAAVSAGSGGRRGRSSACPRASGSTISGTGHTLSTRSGATLKDTMVRAGQSSEKAALIYQHSDDERQQEVAAGLDETVRRARQEASAVPDDPPGKQDDQPSGTNLARDE